MTQSSRAPKLIYTPWCRRNTALVDTSHGPLKTPAACVQGALQNSSGTNHSSTGHLTSKPSWSFERTSLPGPGHRALLCPIQLPTLQSLATEDQLKGGRGPAEGRTVYREPTQHLLSISSGPGRSSGAVRLFWSLWSRRRLRWSVSFTGAVG